jgi:FkbM family methyltransferase
MMPLPPTRFTQNPYVPEWFERDFFHSPDGVREFPDHHCKQTFLVSQPYIRQFRNAVDIGCRDGEYTRYLQHYFQHTWCFDPRAMKNFCFNVDLKKVTHFCCALGDAQSVIQMSGGTHRLVEGRMYSVPCYRLDDFGLDSVDYIKIDVEGYERKVLCGAEQTILRDRPLIVIEQNDVRLPDEEPYAARHWLEQRGYRHAATCPRGWDCIMVPES